MRHLRTISMLRAGRGDRFVSVEAIGNGIVTRADRILQIEEHMTFWIDDAAKTFIFSDGQRLRISRFGANPALPPVGVRYVALRGGKLSHEVMTGCQMAHRIGGTVIAG
jgi:hypothetical protein